MSRASVFRARGAPGLDEIARVYQERARQPQLIWLAGGSLAPEAVPVDLVRAAAARAFERGPRVLDYGAPRGQIEAGLVSYLQGVGTPADERTLVVTAGSLQAISLATRALVAPGDTIVTEDPTYSLVLGTFRQAGARVVGVPMMQDGPSAEVLDATFARLVRAGRRPRFFYTIPDFQNPTGICCSLQRRREVLEICGRHEVLILEDAAYHLLYYTGGPVPTLRELGGDRVLHVGSFSKIFGPGLRVGYAIGTETTIERIVKLKQYDDFCTGVVNQAIVEQLLVSGVLDAQLERIRQVHGAKLGVAARACEVFQRGRPALMPHGGLFIWIDLPSNANAVQVMERALALGVAVVSSVGFIVSRKRPAIRVCFTMAPPSALEHGIHLLAKAASDVASVASNPDV